MNYELAKKLKDAGYTNYSKCWSGTDDSPNPTLSELIEACDNCGLALFERNHLWEAYSEWGGDDYTHFGKGSTPDEAVANLWIALNKK